MNPAPEDKELPNCPRCGSSLSYSMGGLCPRCMVMENLSHDSPAPEPTRKKTPSLDELAKALPEIHFKRLIGQGGMGAVYHGQQIALERQVAVKILMIDESENPEFVERFRIEAQALARLSHPNIVAVYEVGEREEFVYLVMEYVSGTNLAHLIKSGNIEAEQSLILVTQICQALQYSHDAGVIHRDIKPANILVDSQGKVRIADFGIAKLLDSDNGLLTVEGERLGTPLYMAPEQRSGSENVDRRADIYSLGVVFYEMLTGQLPSGKVDPPSQRSRQPVSSRVDSVVMRSMDPEPDRRFQNAHEVESQIAKIQAGRHLWKGALLVATLIAGICLVSSLFRNESPPLATEKNSPSEKIEVLQFKRPQQVIVPGSSFEHRAGHSLIIRKDGLLLLGAPQGMPRSYSAGTGYVSAMILDEQDKWVETHRLLPTKGESKAGFGLAMASNDHQVFIAASFARKIYVYDAPLGTHPKEWTVSQILTPPESFQWGDFGGNIALRDNRLVVSLYSRNGGYFLFEREPVTAKWDDPIFLRPLKNDSSLFCGNAVALDDEIIAVSSRFLSHPKYPNCGCVELFEQVNGSWEHTTRIFPEPMQAKLDAGRGLAFDGPNRLLIGVVGERDGKSTVGSVQIFEREAGTTKWKMSHKLFAPGKPRGSFGRRLKIFDDRLLVGSDNFTGDNISIHGCAYEFLRDPDSVTGWKAHRQFLSTKNEQYRNAMGYQFDRAGEWTAFGTPLATQKAGGAYVLREITPEEKK